MFAKIHLWSHLLLDFCLLGVFFNSWFQCQYLWLICSCFLYLRGSVLGDFFFFKKIVDLFGCTRSSLLPVGFPWLQRVRATLHCGAWASLCSGFSCCGTKLWGVWARYLWFGGSVVEVHGLSCSTACEVFPDQGVIPCRKHWQMDS